MGNEGWPETHYMVLMHGYSGYGGFLVQQQVQHKKEGDRYWFDTLGMVLDWFIVAVIKYI